MRFITVKIALSTQKKLPATPKKTADSKIILRTNI